jgi:hypothetical protein
MAVRKGEIMTLMAKLSISAPPKMRLRLEGWQQNGGKKYALL